MPDPPARRLVSLRYAPTPAEREALERVLLAEVLSIAGSEQDPGESEHRKRWEAQKQELREALYQGQLSITMKGDGVSYDVRGTPRDTPGLEHLHIGTWRADTVDVQYAPNGQEPADPEDLKESLSRPAYVALVNIVRHAIEKHRAPLGDGNVTVQHVSPPQPENPLVRAPGPPRARRPTP